MSAKQFDTALYVGRFNIFHKGHESVADLALNLCDRLIIMVGSAQESGTLRNPFRVSTRIEMIKEVYPDNNVIVVPLNDLTNENDITPEWGKYVIKECKSIIHKSPEIMIYGNDECRSKWFDASDIRNVTEVIVNRAKLDISATDMRERMLLNDVETWFKFHNPRLHKHFDRLRGELLTTKPYKDLFDSYMAQDEYKGWSDYDTTIRKKYNKNFDGQIFD